MGPMNNQSRSILEQTLTTQSGLYTFVLLHTSKESVQVFQNSDNLGQDQNTIHQNWLAVNRDRFTLQNSSMRKLYF